MKETLDWELIWSSKKVQANTFYSIGLEKRLPNLPISKKLGFIKSSIVFNGTFEQVVYTLLNFDVSQPKLKYKKNILYYSHEELVNEIKKLPDKLKWKSGNFINKSNGERSMAEIDYTYFVFPMYPMLRSKWVCSFTYDVKEEQLNLFVKIVTPDKNTDISKYSIKIL
jgi:hypothetical protein